MKLSNELKNKLGNAKSEQEAKNILAETKQNVQDTEIVLEDKELDEVSGGSGKWGITLPYYNGGDTANGNELPTTD